MFIFAWVKTCRPLGRQQRLQHSHVPCNQANACASVHSTCHHGEPYTRCLEPDANKVYFGTDGALPPLIALLRSPQLVVQEQAAVILRCVCTVSRVCSSAPVFRMVLFLLLVECAADFILPCQARCDA